MSYLQRSEGVCTLMATLNPSAGPPTQLPSPQPVTLRGALRASAGWLPSTMYTHVLMSHRDLQSSLGPQGTMGLRPQEGPEKAAVQA